MLIVAPRGSTKLATFSETPKFSVTFFIDTGRVAALLDVLKAVIAAGAIPLKNLIGFILPNTLTNGE